MKSKYSLFFNKLISSKKFTIPFSIFLSFVIWIIITIAQKPTIERTFSDMTVAINLENTFAAENEMSLIGDISNQRFTVLVMGPTHVVNALSSKDINLYASAATVDSPGEYELSVSATQSTVASDYDVLSITPKTVKVKFDYIETREFTVEALADGVTASNGLIAETPVVGGLESNIISITGPRTTINKIAAVKAKTSVNRTLSETETFDADIVLYNEKGKKLSRTNLTLSADKVAVTVPISKRKTVPVKVDFSNTPKEFKKNTLDTKVDYASVEIIGTPATVDKTKSITLTAIDLATVSKGANVFEVSAKLPEGVRLVDGIENFKVTVNLNDYIVRTITVSRVRYTGLPSGLKTSGVIQISNVKVCGPRAVINNLDLKNVYAQGDLSGKKAGQHTVNVSVNFDKYTNVWAVGTYQASITIE